MNIRKVIDDISGIYRTPARVTDKLEERSFDWIPANPPTDNPTMKNKRLVLVIAATSALIAVGLGLYAWFVVFGGMAIK